MRVERNSFLALKAPSLTRFLLPRATPYLIFAKGIVRGLEVAGVIAVSQGVDLLEFFEKVYVQRDSYLRHGTVSNNGGVEDQSK